MCREFFLIQFFSKTVILNHLSSLKLELFNLKGRLNFLASLFRLSTVTANVLNVCVEAKLQKLWLIYNPFPNPNFHRIKMMSACL